ncbi:serine hydrolase domain-containing protein [Ekhidna sp.]|uniref:serine hydrolase domain-containing protein n=1 Tax=Ekhidna sp. TaxID=2608089 RepID=UPI003B58B63F
MSKFYLIWFLFLAQLNGWGQQLDQSVLDQIIEKAEQSNSDALIIKKSDNVIVKKGKDSPVYIASAGKSLTSLGIGMLLMEGFLDSLDQPVYSLYPEWEQGNKKFITVRMLLNHTSGLQNHPNASVELEPAPDYKVDNIIKLALAAELENKPGQEVSYNNKAVALLGGVIEAASGLRMDEFFEKYFFDPMDIKDVSWIRDRAGNPTAHGAFIIKPSDLLKFGTLMLNGGKYEGTRILPEEWVEESFQPGQTQLPIWGLLWWRLPAYEKRVIDEELIQTWRERGASSDLIDKVLPIVDKVFSDKHSYYNEMELLLGETWGNQLDENNVGGKYSSKRIYSDDIVAYYADGFRGNYLVVIPEKEIVAVRCADPNGFNYQTDFFPDFVELTSKL